MAKAERNPKAYEAHKDRAARRQAELSESGRDIGPLPPVKDAARKATARESFRSFCESYLPATFCLEWSDDHLETIAAVEAAVLRGELLAFAMPRGSGKTSLVEAAALWSLLYGHREFVTIIGSDEGHASTMLESIKVECETNEILLEDFPEAIFPIMALERIHQRAKGQLFQGKPTHIQWTANEVQFPTIPGSPASSGIIRVAGITGRIRGMTAKRASDGRKVRPTLVLIDDPQTDEALDIDTVVPTPSGFKKLADISVGDVLFDENGTRCNVIDATDVFCERECYRVEFDDGAWVVADAGHLWTTSTQLQRTNLRRKVANPNPSFAKRPQCQPKPYQSVRTTLEIRNTLTTAKDQRANHSIPFEATLQTEQQSLPIDPYTLGAWLGDGFSWTGRVCGVDKEIFQEIDKIYARVSTNTDRGEFCVVNYKGLRSLLRINGLLGNKHVPIQYMIASADQRLALLQGLMDTDGSVTSGIQGTKGTRCTFSNTNYKLISGVAFLCRSLGIKATITEIMKTARMASRGWKVNFITSVPVFRLPRKLKKLPAATRKDTKRRYITSVTPVESRPVRCIKVDSPSQLFLCGEELIATHNSARSPSQVASREAVLKGAILGLAGPGVKISGLATVTVIHQDDLADRLLDRNRHPAWQGRRFKLVYAWPTETALWDEYAELRRRGQRDGHGTTAADEFYAANQAAMDAGSRVAWPARKQSDELTAIQHAWNLRIDRGEAAFAAEFQNEPIEQTSRADGIQAADVATKTINVPRWIVPTGMDTLTAFVDVQKELLYWCVVAWGHQLRGHVVAYGSYPDQGRPYFTLRDAKRTLSQAHGDNVEAAILAGLEAVGSMLLDREFGRENDDAVLRVNQLFIDANWAQTQGVVRDFARRSKWGPRVLPTHGRFVGASGQTISDKAPDRGERIGANWRTSTIQKQRHVLYDTNAWKTFLAARVKLPVGDPQGFTFHAGEHDMLAEQMASEIPVRVESKMRIVDEWRLTPGRDNHLWDCCIGASVAASYTGLSAVGVEVAPRVERRRISREEMAAKRQELMGRMGR